MKIVKCNPIICLINFLLIIMVIFSSCKEKANPEKKTLVGSLTEIDSADVKEKPPLPIAFSWSESTPVLSSKSDSVKQDIMAEYNEDDILVITGSYYAEETTPEGYENLGFARADQIRARLFPEIPEDRVILESRLITDSEGARTSYFAAVEMEVYSAPALYDMATQPSPDRASGLEACRSIKILKEVGDTDSKFCDLLDLYISEYGEDGFCADSVLVYKQRYCIQTPYFTPKAPSTCQPRAVSGTRYKAVDLGPIWMLTEDMGRMSWQKALQSCPKGWRLPCETEINYILTYTYGNDREKAHTYLAERENCKPNLSSGIGFRDPQRKGIYWCATENTDLHAWGFQLNHIDGRKSMATFEAKKTEELYCRCVQTNDAYQTKLIQCPNRPF